MRRASVVLPAPVTPAMSTRIGATGSGSSTQSIRRFYLRNTRGQRADVGAVTEPIAIEIWSDIACPWCYIGKRNLEQGLAALQETQGADAPQVNITFHSFELAPDTPVDFDGNEVDFLSG